MYGAPSPPVNDNTNLLLIILIVVFFCMMALAVSMSQMGRMERSMEQLMAMQYWSAMYQ
ncbi:MAG: hypothetical protein K0U52_09825 [Gammaproteobacteria bacterium]|nr:hypothetical protein [Gammaproteobacteria bacterium]